MSMLKDQLEQAKARWIEQKSSLVRYRWKQFQEFGHASAFDKMEETASLFIDAVCSWIEINDRDEVEFVPQVIDADKDVCMVLILFCASKAPRNHILQYLLSLGGFDPLLIQNLQGSFFFMSPSWLQERIMAVLATSSVVEFGSYREQGVEIDLDPYEIGVYPVTQAIYEMIMKENPSRFYGLSRPVDSVTWFDAIKFCNNYSKHADLEEVYEIKENRVVWNTEANGYRLPSEKEWVVAANADQNHLYGASDSWEGLVHCNSKEFMKGTRIVGAGEANSWGLYDCSGNVFEWCWDRFFSPEYPDKRIPRNLQTRIRKGGGWNSNPAACRLDYISDRRPTYLSNNTGFRLVRKL